MAILRSYLIPLASRALSVGVLPAAQRPPVLLIALRKPLCFGPVQQGAWPLALPLTVA